MARKSSWAPAATEHRPLTPPDTFAHPSLTPLPSSLPKILPFHWTIPKTGFRPSPPAVSLQLCYSSTPFDVTRAKLERGQNDPTPTQKWVKNGPRPKCYYLFLGHCFRLQKTRSRSIKKKSVKKKSIFAKQKEKYNKTKKTIYQYIIILQ